MTTVYPVGHQPSPGVPGSLTSERRKPVAPGQNRSLDWQVAVLSRLPVVDSRIVSLEPQLPTS